MTDIQLWLRADHAASSSVWEDSVQGWDAEQSDGDKQPTPISNQANFNPIMRFDGTDDFMDVNHHDELNGQNLTVFIVTKYTGGDEECSSPWTTRHEFDMFLLKNKKGHFLCLHDKKYEYWNGTGTSWDKEDTGVTTSGNYEIATTKSKKNGSKIDKEFFYQGKKEDNDNNIDFSENPNKPFRIGAGKSESSSGGDYWMGDIAEVVVFDQALDSTKRNKVESYLALKYGITLIKQEYHSSNGTKVWEKIKQYKYDVAGVARDDTSDWNQSISKSINSDAIITISTDTDFTSANTDSRPVLSSEDNRYLVWANNNKGSTWTTNKAPLGGKILKRKWRISKTGDTQHNINIQIDVDDLDFDIDTFSGDLYFAHGEMLNHTTLIKMTQNTSDNSKWYVEDINFTDGDLFGFVIALDEPNNQATMVINEVLAIQETTKKDNEEFVEFYVTQRWDIR